MVDNQSEDNENELMYIYEWVDSVPLSRPKKNIGRDFCDGVLLAEIIKHYLPKLVDLHNYPSASSTNQKNYNWTTLNNKVLRKIGVTISKQEINDIISCRSLSVEQLLQRVYKAIEKVTGINIANSGDNPEGNRHHHDSNDRIDELQKALDEKEYSVLQLKDIIEVLEMKLNSSHEMQMTLEAKVKELTQLVRSKGINA